MASRKKWTMGEGKWYFTIKSNPNNITIYRKTKKAALRAFNRYKRLGKEVDWLGKWNGKKFEDTSMPAAAKSA